MEVPLFLQIPEFAKNTVYEWSKEAFMPKFRSIRPAVSIEHRLATDRQTDRQTHGVARLKLTCPNLTEFSVHVTTGSSNTSICVALFCDYQATTT